PLQHDQSHDRSRAVIRTGNRLQCAARHLPVLRPGRAAPTRASVVARRDRHCGLYGVRRNHAVGAHVPARPGGSAMRLLNLSGELAAMLLAATAAALAPFATRSGGAVESAPFPGWPTQYEGRALVDLPLTAREAAFTQDFPGKVGR